MSHFWHRQLRIASKGPFCPFWGRSPPPPQPRILPNPPGSVINFGTLMAEFKKQKMLDFHTCVLLCCPLYVLRVVENCPRAQQGSWTRWFPAGAGGSSSDGTIRLLSGGIVLKTGMGGVIEVASRSFFFFRIALPHTFEPFCSRRWCVRSCRCCCCYNDDGDYIIDFFFKARSNPPPRVSHGVGGTHLRSCGTGRRACWSRPPPSSSSSSSLRS